MARLLKMQIQGIRSFGPNDNDQQMITFQSPVTLILGQNGCGKTTIIEALKYAATGEVPAGTKQGQSFVHDPKMARQPEIRGQIKLLMADCKGEEVVVTRTLQTTQKAKTLQFKTLDPVIHRKKSSGEIVQVGGRCIDVNLEMSHVFGVSKAVLSNVIFCHQEDSNWPMDDGKKLKEKFDSIFDATKLNKCLEHIRDLRKAVMSEISTDEKLLKSQQEIKDETVSKKKDLQEAESRLAVTQDKIDTLSEKLSPLVEKLEEICDVEKDFLQLTREKERAEDKLKIVESQQADLKKNIKEVLEWKTLEEITDIINSFKTEARNWQDHLKSLESELQQICRDEERVLEETSQEQMSLGKLQKEEEDHNTRIEARNKNLQKLAETLQIRVKDDTFSSEILVSNLMHQVDDKIGESKRQFEQLRHRFQREEQELQSKIDTARDTKAKLEQEISSKKRQAEDNKNEEWKVKTEIEDVEKSAEELVKLGRELEQAKTNWETACHELDEEQLKKEIRDQHQESNRLDEKLVIVDKEVQTLQLMSSEQAQLDIQNKLKASKEAELKKLKNKHNEALRHLLFTVPQQNLKHDLDACMLQLTRQINNINDKINSKQNEAAALEVKRAHHKEQLDLKERELKKFEEEIYDLCGRQDFDEYIQSVSDRIQELQDQKGTLSASEYMFRRYIQKLEQEDPCCPLCHREFEAASEAAELAYELSNKVSEVPVRLQDNKKELENKLKEYDKLLQMKPAYEKTHSMRTKEIPELKEALQQTEEALDSARKHIKDLKEQLLGPKAKEQMAKDIQGDVVRIDQLQTELRRIDKEVQELQAKMPSGSSRPMEEALAEQEELRAQVSAIQRALNTKQESLRRHSERVNQLRERKNVLMEKKLKLESGQQKRRQLEERLQELQSMNVMIESEIESIEIRLQEARNMLDSAVQSKNSRVTENRTTVDAEQNKIVEQGRKHDDICSWHKIIQKYEQSGMKEKLQSVQQRLIELDCKKESLADKNRRTCENIDKLKEKISNQQLKARELEDNKMLKEKQAEAVELNSVIEKVKQRLGKFKVKSIEEEKNRLCREISAVKEEKSVSEGRYKELRDNVNTLRRDLNKDIYKNAEKKYNDLQRQIKVNQLASSDLNKYFVALDWSLIYFHQERMRRINMIIRELWRKIYRGNDIDYIEIKTDAPETTSADKKRTFNYRVVQVKNDVEIDMKGRCSAGQKVLASLVIRIALAEILSINCGILALDEPTTNLDRENIDSLGEALTELINLRRDNKNFQLILITHDEDFLDRLMNVEKLKYYYRVTRNAKGNSMVEKYRVEERNTQHRTFN